MSRCCSGGCSVPCCKQPFRTQETSTRRNQEQSLLHLFLMKCFQKENISMIQAPITIYDLSLNVRVSWQAHSLSNAGTNGSNKLMPRRQLLANRTETDACSGNIAKHHHAILLAEYLEAAHIPLCPACSQRDARRAAALTERPEYKDLTMEEILTMCGLCAAHGFLVTAKRAKSKENKETVSAEVNTHWSISRLRWHCLIVMLKPRNCILVWETQKRRGKC